MGSMFLLIIFLFAALVLPPLLGTFIAVIVCAIILLVALKQLKKIGKK